MAKINKKKSNKNFCTELKVQNITLYKLLYEVEKSNKSDLIDKSKKEGIHKTKD